MLTFSPQALADLQRDLMAFLPECILIGIIVIMLLLRLTSGFAKTHLGILSLLAVLGALGVALMQWIGSASLPTPDPSLRYFTGLLAYDYLTIFLRLLLLTFAALGIVLTMLTSIPDAEDSGDFYVLFLGGTLGMMLMSSANHLLMVYIAVEMASVPSYALAGFLKGQRRSGEASLKYVVYGGGASGIMLYGISLVAGKFGTGDLVGVGQGVAAVMAAPGTDVTLALGLVFILIGLAFKLSAVPFHFWCPDVFEGAAAEIGAFLSVSSKAAAMALTGRLVLTLGRFDMVHAPATFGPALALFAAVTATFGNLAAYPQNNLKRLLAYSTIAHAGYMMMGLAIVRSTGLAAVLFYLATYLFTNLGAFAVVAFLRNKTGSEDLQSFSGLVQTEPGLVVALGVFLLSLLGLPPLAGFAGKFVIFSALFDAANEAYTGPSPWLSNLYWALLVIGGLNTAISAFYYIRVLRVMILDKPPETEVAQPRVSFAAVNYVTLLAVIVFGLGIAWNFLSEASDKGVKFFPRGPATVATVPGGSH